MKKKAEKQLNACVVMETKPVDKKMAARFTALAEVTETRMVRRDPVKYRSADLEMFVLGAQFKGDDYDHFRCSGGSWWTNGLDDQEWLSETFVLFSSPEAIKEGINRDFVPPAKTVQLNIYSLSLTDGEITFHLEETLVRESDLARRA
jgi:hypothetical protein